MKRVLLSVISVLVFTAVNPGCGLAQDRSQAERNYQSFIQLYNGGATDKNAMYTYLIRSYRDYIALLGASPADQALKEKLRSIYPHLINGAAYYSQRGQSGDALEFAVAYVDLPKHRAFQGERFTRDDYYPTLVYFAATGTYNSKRFGDAVNFFQDYIDSGATEKLQDCYYYMSKAYGYRKDDLRQLQILEAGVERFPAATRLIYEMVNCCITQKRTDKLEWAVNKALAINPEDMNVLPAKAKLLADNGRLEEALGLYTRIYNRKPNDARIVKQYAAVCYNYAAAIINNANMIGDDRQYARQRQDANKYLGIAEGLFRKILQSEPSSVKYLSALADTYKCMGRTEEANAIVHKIQMYGGTYVASATVAGNPVSPGGAGNGAVNSSRMQTGSERPGALPAKEIPSFASYVKAFVEKGINAWQRKDDYETLTEYQARVTDEKRQQKIKELAKQAENDFVAAYSPYVDWNTLKLGKYDAENEVFLIETPLWGNLLLPVPRTNNEARLFENQWNNVKAVEPQFFIADDKLALAEVTFRTPLGKTYRYNNQASLNYQATEITYNFAPVDLSDLKTVAGHDIPRAQGNISTQKVNVGKSDVDINIPQSRVTNEKRFAVIIANENYRRESKVEFANNDGAAFRQYCIKALGLPEKNVHYVADATYNDMKAELDWVTTVARAYDGEADVLFYYAGHGVPDEETKSAYLLPVDGYGSNVSTGYSLAKLYETLSAMPAKSVTVLLDACFSGAKRDGQVMASSARGVAIKADSGEPKGNMVVLTAATGNETAYPYKEKKHGLFTYFLLKKIQETKGKVSYAELVDYIRTEVSRKSIVENNKSQTPTLIPAAEVGESWKKWNLK